MTLKLYKVTTSWGTSYETFARNKSEAIKNVERTYLRGCDYRRSDIKATSNLM